MNGIMAARKYYHYSDVKIFLKHFHFTHHQTTAGKRLAYWKWFQVSTQNNLVACFPKPRKYDSRV